MDKKLFRSKKDRMLFGVAGGIAEYFGIDSTIVRLIFVVLTIWGGAGIILYVIGIFLIPEDEDSKKNTKTSRGRKRAEERIQAVASEIRLKTKEKPFRGEFFWGIIILLVGILILFNNVIRSFNFARFWPLILVVAGIIILAESSRKELK